MEDIYVPCEIELYQLVSLREVGLPKTTHHVVRFNESGYSAIAKNKNKYTILFFDLQNKYFNAEIFKGDIIENIYLKNLIKKTETRVVKEIRFMYLDDFNRAQVVEVEAPENVDSLLLRNIGKIRLGRFNCKTIGFDNCKIDIDPMEAKCVGYRGENQQNLNFSKYGKIEYILVDKQNGEIRVGNNVKRIVTNRRCRVIGQTGTCEVIYMDE